MKNRESKHHFVHFVERNAPYLYCLRGNWVGALLNTTFLTSVFRPPPANVTVNFNNTLRQNNFECNGSSTVAVPARPFWIVVGFFCYVQFVLHMTQTSVIHLPNLTLIFS